MFKRKHDNLSHIPYNKTCTTCDYKKNCKLKEAYKEFQNKLMDINQEQVGKYPFIAHPSCYYTDETRVNSRPNITDDTSFKLTNLSI